MKGKQATHYSCKKKVKERDKNKKEATLLSRQ